jgi:hypothetical protein
MTIALFALWLAAAGPAAAPGAEPAPCTCLAAAETNGWCEAHSIGWIGNVEVPYRILWETLDAHGHVLDLGAFECETCRAAIASSGFCERDRIGFVDGLAYFSRVTYELARAARTDVASLACPVCRKNAEGRGWCDACKRGMVGGLAIADARAYAEAAKVLAILEEAIAVAERCEHCAVAMITDTECPVCRIRYRDGHPLPRAAPPPAQPR